MFGGAVGLGGLGRGEGGVGKKDLFHPGCSQTPPTDYIYVFLKKK